jgi:hypothetical protein
VVLEAKDFIAIGATVFCSGLPLVLLVGYRVGRWTHALDGFQSRLSELTAALEIANRERRRTDERLADVDRTLVRVADRVGVPMH